MSDNLVLQGQQIILLLQQIAKQNHTILISQQEEQLDAEAIVNSLTSLQNELDYVKKTLVSCCNLTQQKLDQILEAVQPPPAVGLSVTVTAFNSQGEISMSKKAFGAAVDVQIQDNGSALYTFSAVDAEGQPTVFPTGTPALSNIIVTDPYVTANPGANSLWNVVVNASDPTGLSLVGTPVNPLPAGVVLPDLGVGVSAQTTFPNATSPVTGVAPLIDIIAGPASGIAVAVASQQ